jgi:hypothetical protein
MPVAYRYHYHRHHRRPCCSRRGGAGKRVLYILAVGVVVAAAVSMFRGRSDRYVSPPPGPARMSGMSASRLQDYAADRAIVGGAAAAEKVLATQVAHQNERPEPGEGDGSPNRTVTISTPVARDRDAERVTDLGKSKPAIKLKVTSDKPYTSRDMALNDALIKAGEGIRDALKTLNPPVEAHPGWAKVKADYLRPESVRYIEPTPEQKQAWAKDGERRIDDTNRYWAEIEVELTDSDIRELRSEHRIGAGGVVAAVGFVLVLALFGFLRLDAWTKGYLTGGLAVAVVAAAGAAVALLVLA